MRARGAGAASQRSLAILFGAFHERGDVGGARPVAARVAEHVTIERDGEGIGRGAGADRAEQRRVGATDGVAVLIGERVGVELVEQGLVPDRTEEPDAWVGERPDPGRVLVGVGRVADDHEGERRVARAVALHDDVDVVLGLEAGDDEVVLAGLDADLGQPLRMRRLDDGCAVGDQLGRRTELLLVVLPDAIRVGDERIGPSDREDSAIR